MAKLNLPIQSFEIKYETAPEIPPPYCYYYYVRGKVEKNNLSIEIEWVYHHREDLTADEITDEGFTGNDNFSWRGNIGILWLEELEKQIAQTQVTNKISEEAPFMHIVIQSRNGNMLNGYPVNVDDWDYFMQEFIQGIYEASGKEAPLEIRFKKITQTKLSIR